MHDDTLQRRHEREARPDGLSGGARRAVLFLAGRDPKHPKAGGGDIQAWAWATWVSESGGRVVYVCQADPSLPSSEWCNGIRVLRLGSGTLLPWRAWRGYVRHRARFDVVYEDPIGAGRTPYFSPLYSAVPVVAVWHQVSAELLLELYGGALGAGLSFVERLVALVYRRSHLWVPSRERAEDLVRVLGFARSKIHVIPPTIPNDWLSHDVSGEREMMVLSLGVIRPYKAVHHVIEAFPAVLAAVPDARLVIAGRPFDAEYSTQLREEVTRRGLEEHIDFVFDLSEEEKRSLLQRARALVLPSRLEGFGIVALEAGALGTPVIASTGVPESAVRHLENGLRFGYGDIPQLSSAMRQVLQDSVLFWALSHQGRRHAARFVPAAVGPSFDALVDAALADAGALRRHTALRGRAAALIGRLGLESPRYGSPRDES